MNTVTDPELAQAAGQNRHLTRRYCEVLSSIRYADLTETAKSSARRLALDGIAVAVAGADYPGPTLLREALGSAGGACSLIGSATKVDAMVAARANGAAMHVLDFEAMWSPANHATSTTLPAILAAAQLARSDGRVIMEAYVAGLEAQGRLRLASRMIEPRSFTFHPPGQVGPIGAAVAASRILGLDVAQLTHAVGIAASTCGSLMANAGSMTKALHCGNAAANGLMAAILVGRGFTANAEIFDAPFGFVGTVVSMLDEDDLTHVDRPLMIDSPGYAIKLFPSQYGTHFGINAALDAAAQIPDPADIVGAVLHTPDMRYVDRALPRTGLEGKFSFQYTVALALLDRAVKIDSFTDACLGRADIQRLLPNIRVATDLGQPAGFEDMAVRLVVRLKNGSEITTICTAPRGYLIKGAPVGDEEIAAKARDCLARRLDEATRVRVIDAVQRLDELDADGVAELMSWLQN